VGCALQNNEKQINVLHMNRTVLKSIFYIKKNVLFIIGFLKVLSNESGGGSNPSILINCRQVSFAGPKLTPSREEHKSFQCQCQCTL
jgi:hypothetical protein